MNRAPSLFLLLYTWALTLLGLKMSLPALPYLEAVFQVPESAIRASVTGFFFAFGIGQLFWGYISDIYGRKKPLIVGLFVTAIGTILALSSESLTVYIIGRCIEGVGLASVSPIARAILFETRSADRATKELGIVSMSTAFIPAVAQITGGYLMAFAGWRWIFATFLLLVCVAIASISMRLNETLEDSNAPKVHFIRSLKKIVPSKTFWKWGIAYMACSGTLFGYYAAMPYWYIDDLQYKTYIYPYLACFNVASYVLGILVSHRISKKKPIEVLVPYGLLCAVIPGLLLTALSFFTIGDTTLVVSVVASTCLLAFSAGLVFSGANKNACRPFEQARALAAAVLIFGVFISSGIMAFIAGGVDVHRLHIVGLILLLPPAIAIVIHYGIRTESPLPE